ncbi:MAG: L-arabinose isomerase [Marinilabilia sp.]
MRNNENKQLWFITGSQHLYGPEALEEVAANSREVVKGIDQNLKSPVKVVFQSVLTTSDDILELFRKANADENCIGIIAWMHTFSPAQMWINGLNILKKPLLHLHTQYNRDIPWNEIDMDFMNLNQAAHGDREFGFICSRMKIKRQVVVGHWKEEKVVSDIDDWTRAAMAWNESQNLKVVRFGDNMRNVAVTEGDKVEAHKQFGWTVSGYGVGELVHVIDNVTEKEVKDLIEEYRKTYQIAKNVMNDKETYAKLEDSARIEIGLERFLEEGGFQAFTTTFEDLHGMKQLPGLAVQRLMEKGYGFGAEGDWKTAALLRCMKVMSKGLDGGTSFMEDYTYHLDPAGNKVLGAHMLEVCPSIATGKPSLEVHPLSIGGKDDPARLVFSVKEGEALNASLLDMGNRFRLLVNTVTAVKPKDTPKLPVAKALWTPHPDLETSARAWILAGGAHHTGFSFAVKPQHLEMFAEMAGIEYLLIDKDTTVRDFKNELRWNDVSYS